MFKLLEKLPTNSHLGIRFWDPVLDQKIGEGLQVTARAENARRPAASAQLTRSNIYSFRSLAGMRELEHSDREVDENPSPPLSRNYIVEVTDLQRRYVAVGFKVTLPLSRKGVFPSANLASPPQASPKGFYLYSSATRSVPVGMTVLRGELFDVDRGAAAANAVVRVRTQDDFSWYGVADASGRVAVIMPYPARFEGIGGASPPSNNKRIFDQTWDLQVEVLYQPGALESLANSSLHEYRSILRQQSAQIWPEAPDEGGVATSSWQVEQRYGQPTILKTRFLDESTVAIERRAKLLVTPAASPP